MILCLAGHPSIDKLYEVDAVRPGEIHRPGVPVAVPGGKGLNVARVIRRLNGEPHVAGILAGHAGRWIEAALAAEGIPGTFVWAPGETRTSISIAAAGRLDVALTEFYEDSPPVQPEVWDELELATAELLPEAKLLCVSGSLMPGAPVEGYRRAIELAHEQSVSVALDSFGPQLLEALGAHPELVKLNAQEAVETLGIPGPTHDPLGWALDAAAEIRERAGGESACVVTCGRDGMSLVDRSGAAFRGRVDAVGRYPVGSGDAALAALALAMVSGDDSPAMVAAALGAGAANAETPGPGKLDADRARALASRAEVVRVES